MPRVKRGVGHNKKRRNLLAQTKGYLWGRKSKVRQAKIAVLKAGVHAYMDRKKKKRVMRGLWLLRINAATRLQGLSYSKFMGGLKKKNVEIDRKVLSQLAKDYPEVFNEVVTVAK